jgi:hypothetical protein
MSFHDLIGSCSPAPWSRRRLLTAGGLGMLGLTMPRILRASEAANTEKLIARAK